MATLRAAVKTALTADATLMAILTGGINDFEGYGRLGLTPSNATYAADGITLLPCAVITWSTETPAMETYSGQGRRRFMQLWVYSHASYATIDSALRRAETVLHRLKISTDDVRQALLIYANDGPDYVDDTMQGALARFSRYAVQFSRR